MAEFKEIVMKLNELCDYYKSCADCPLIDLECNKLNNLTKLDELEEIVMNWEKPVDMSNVEVDWSKVEVDTKILVKDFEDSNWVKMYFAEYKNGKVYTFNGGRTNWNADNTYYWRFAKLWEGEE